MSTCCNMLRFNDSFGYEAKSFSIPLVTFGASEKLTSKRRLLEFTFSPVDRQRTVDAINDSERRETASPQNRLLLDVGAMPYQNIR